METHELQHVIEQFHCLPGTYQFSPLGNGLIHQTFLAECGNASFVLQRMNTAIFPEPEKVMANILLANTYLNAPGYESVSYITAKAGKSLLVKESGGLWRLMKYIPKSITFGTPSGTAMAFEAGRVIGLFHHLMEEANPAAFYQILPDFHHLGNRWQQLASSAENADRDRRTKGEGCRKLAKALYHDITDKLPQKPKVRVAHNDTKFDNILFDDRTGLAIGLIDLDTIMPGYFHTDFGDVARGICFNVSEIGPAQSGPEFLPQYFKALVQGVYSSGLRLTEEEIHAMAPGVLLMPLLHGVRALTDYLEGDRYYKVTYEEGNLDRARRLLNQANMALEAIPEMNRIIDQCRSGHS